MILSEGRQRLFAKLIINGLWGDELIDFDEDNEDEVMRRARRLISEWVASQGDIDQSVRAKISTQKSNLMEGTQEWTILYRKYYQEELQRRGHK